MITQVCQLKIYPRQIKLILLKSVCNRFQDCKPPSECPAVVRDFKEKKIHPTICSFQSRSLSVCCNKTRSVTVTPSPVVNITQCGVSRTRRVFQFKLRARQGDLPITIASTEAPILTVVGGQEAEENSYPWMAAIGSQLPQLAFESNPKYNWFCGGSYLGGNLILTAAHCIPTPGQGLSLDIVRLGAHNLGFSRKEATADDYRIKSVVVHPNYNASGLVPVNDIAIIVLQTEGKSFEVWINNQSTSNSLNFGVLMILVKVLYHEEFGPFYASLGNTSNTS